MEILNFAARARPVVTSLFFATFMCLVGPTAPVNAQPALNWAMNVYCNTWADKAACRRDFKVCKGGGNDDVGGCVEIEFCRYSVAAKTVSKGRCLKEVRVNARGPVVLWHWENGNKVVLRGDVGPGKETLNGFPARSNDGGNCVDVLNTSERFCAEPAKRQKKASRAAAAFSSVCAVFNGDRLIDHQRCQIEKLEQGGRSEAEEGGQTLRFTWRSGASMTMANVEEWHTIDGKDAELRPVRPGFDVCVLHPVSRQTFCYAK